MKYQRERAQEWMRTVPINCSLAATQTVCLHAVCDDAPCVWANDACHCGSSLDFGCHAELTGDACTSRFFSMIEPDEMVDELQTLGVDSEPVYTFTYAAAVNLIGYFWTFALANTSNCVLDNGICARPKQSAFETNQLAWQMHRAFDLSDSEDDDGIYSFVPYIHGPCVPSHAACAKCTSNQLCWSDGFEDQERTKERCFCLDDHTRATPTECSDTSLCANGCDAGEKCFQEIILSDGTEVCDCASSFDDPLGRRFCPRGQCSDSCAWGNEDCVTEGFAFNQVQCVCDGPTGAEAEGTLSDLCDPPCSANKACLWRSDGTADCMEDRVSCYGPQNCQSDAQCYFGEHCQFDENSERCDCLANNTRRKRSIASKKSPKRQPSVLPFADVLRRRDKQIEHRKRQADAGHCLCADTVLSVSSITSNTPISTNVQGVSETMDNLALIVALTAVGACLFGGCVVAPIVYCVVKKNHDANDSMNDSGDVRMYARASEEFNSARVDADSNRAHYGRIGAPPQTDYIDIPMGQTNQYDRVASSDGYSSLPSTQ